MRDKIKQKNCSRCKEDKNISFFSKDNTKSRDGLQSQCKDCKCESLKIFYKNNPHKRNKRTKEQGRERYRRNKLNANMSRSIRRALAANGQIKYGSWRSLVDYSIEQLKDHLESKFKDGMSWDNYGEWHIDHIKPISSFNITSTDCEDFRKCWDLENLQPLWAFENISKGCKIIN